MFENQKIMPEIIEEELLSGSGEINHEDSFAID